MHTTHPDNPHAATVAIEGNTAAFLVAMGRAGGADERDDAQIHWVIGGSPLDYHNCVVRAHLPLEDVAGAIDASIALFAAHGVPGSWHLGPSARPTDLGARLLARGFVDGGQEAGMALDLKTWQDRRPVPEGFEIEHVDDEHALQQWTQTLAAGFGEGEREARWVGAMYRRMGYDTSTPWRHYLGRLDGVPVATATLFMDAGVAGIYFVFTRPEARRRGIGAAITAHGLRDARTFGCHTAVLGASAMGVGVYRALGFEVGCTLNVYTWEHVGQGVRADHSKHRGDNHLMGG